MRALVAGEVLRFIRRHSSAPASESEFNALALRVFRLQFDKNLLYRRFCEMEGLTPRNLENWKQIPAVPAAAFKELVLTCFPPRKKKKIFKTSGTTLRQAQGEPRQGAHYFETLRLYEASIAPPFREHMLTDGPFAFYFLISPPAEAPHSSLSHMMKVVNALFAKGKGRFYAGRGGARFGSLARDLKKERKKALLLATAFSLKGFFDFMRENALYLRLPKGSRIMETGGFKGRTREVSKKELYRLCGSLLGVPARECVSEYGMTELSSQYYSTNSGPFSGPAWLRAVLIDPATGEECRRGRPGLLKHVDLANIGSVMAVQTEDLGRQKGGGFEFLGRASESDVRGCSLSYERFLRSSG